MSGGKKSNESHAKRSDVSPVKPKVPLNK